MGGRLRLRPGARTDLGRRLHGFAHVRRQTAHLPHGFPTPAVRIRISLPRCERENSGLGLSISKQIVNAHGGKIWAENADRNGEISGGRVVLRLPEMPEDFRL